MTVRHRVLLAAYPPSFRERYGEELDALLEDTGTGPRVVLDLALAAARAWLRPVRGADPSERRRLRLTSTVSTLWVVWCVVVVGTMGTLRLLEDPAAPGLDLHTDGWVALGRAAQVAMATGALLIVAVGAPIGWRVLRSSREARRTMLGPVVVLAGVVLGFLPLLGFAVTTTSPRSPRDFPAWFVIDLLGWTVLVAVASVWWTLAVPRALREGAPAAAALLAPAMAAPALAALLLVPTTTLVAVALATGSAWGAPVAVLTTGCTATVVAAAVCGVVSAARGIAALRVSS